MIRRRMKSCSPEVPGIPVDRGGRKSRGRNVRFVPASVVPWRMTVEGRSLGRVGLEEGSGS